MGLPLRHKIVRRWTRIKTELSYEWDIAMFCWCGSILPIIEVHYGETPVTECAECGTGVLRRRLTSASYERWYRTGDYRRWVKGTTDVDLGQFVREFKRGLSAIKMLRQDLFYPAGHSVLDFGCGAGGTLAAFLAAGCTEVEGVDSDPRSKWLGGTLQIRVFPGMPQSYWDIIVLSHVIEHVIRPDEFLRWVADHLSIVTHGRLYIETPVWTEKAEIKLPHVWYFTPESFRVLAERAGLKVVAMDNGIRAVLRRAG